MNNTDYNSGYGQCRSDLLEFIKQAMSEIHSAIEEADKWTGNDPVAIRKYLQTRIQELQRLRAFIRTMKPKHG